MLIQAKSRSICLLLIEWDLRSDGYFQIVIPHAYERIMAGVELEEEEHSAQIVRVCTS